MKRLISIVLVVMLMSTMLMGCQKEEKDVYASRSVNNIIPFGPGGGTDLWNRALAASMEATLGQKVISSNMTGGTAGSTGTSYVWGGPHDGYTILGTSETPLTIPVMTGIEQTSKDWEYFIAGGSPGILLANKASGYTNFEDLIAAAKSAPDEIKIASTSGGLWFLLANLFNGYADVPLGNVTYDGSRPAITACVSGETALVIASAGEVAEFVKSGDLIPLTTTQKEDYDMPGFGVIQAVTKQLPVLEKNLPLSQFIGFCVPMDTPEDIKAKLRESFKAAMETPEIKEFATAQYAVIYNLTEKEASEFAAKAESIMSWMLDDLKLSKFSPADLGIAKP